jgi:AcrR family transcriptional regulator
MPHDPAPLRDRLVAAALSILGESGGGALTVRAVAAQAGCSTMGVYTHFSGKPGLLDAIIAEGFTDFDAFVSEHCDHLVDGYERLLRGATAYREWALAHRTQYQVMFTPYVPGFEPSAATLACGAQSFDRHLSRVTYALERGEIRGSMDAAETIAAHLWGSSHGQVMLSLLRGAQITTQPDAEWFGASARWTLDGIGSVSAADAREA